jgi:vacuolar fusion protein MON1
MAHSLRHQNLRVYELHTDATIGLQNEILPMDTLQDDPKYASGTQESTSRSRSADSEGPPPPLPPRAINLLNKERYTHTRNASQSTNQNLQSKATTALSLTDISPRSNQDSGSQDPPTIGFGSINLGRDLKAEESLSQLASARGSEIGDSASIRSYFPISEPGDEESLFDDFILTDSSQEPSGTIGLSGHEGFLIDDGEDDFASEFQPVGELDADCKNEGL